MNRIDRLTAILLLLQGGKRTAGEIAAHFEVSRRTILRDIQALCEMDIPIVAEAGMLGGYTLLPDFSLPPLALTFNEALLLRLALSSLSQLGETPFKQERESLLVKIQTLIPQKETHKIAQFGQTLSLEVPSRSYPTPFLDLLLESAHAQQWVKVRYRSEKRVSQQTILPQHVRTSAGLWYCEAYAYEHQEKRVYRVDRFLEVTKTCPPQTEPHFADVPRGDPTLPEVRIQLSERGVFLLDRDPHLGPLIQRREAEGDGWLCVRFHPREYDWLIRVVLSLGVEATVHAPEELRQRLRQEVQAVAQHHLK